MGLGAETSEPSRCYLDQQNAYASTSCQLFYGAQQVTIALASRDDGSVRLDNPLVVPARSTDYQLRFEGNSVIPAATSGDDGGRRSISYRPTVRRALRHPLKATALPLFVWPT
jgi:hypothetical protein